MQAEGTPQFEYVGFWPRFAAFVINSILIVVLVGPLLALVLGAPPSFDPLAVSPEAAAELLRRSGIETLVLLVLYVLLWTRLKAEPGKLVIKAEVVDAKTGAPPTALQATVRFLGYFVSTIPLCIGHLWVAFDKRKQGWHDKLAGTVVVKKKPATQ
jgi:uncharacterized RDD family membrane protein YckC